MEKIKIRNEKNTDYEATEMIIKKAFWNLYVPGCSEHYLAHILRSHEDFVPELDLVIEADNKIIGNIMYTKSRLADETGNIKNILTFGPVCIAPEYQRRGYGKVNGLAGGNNTFFHVPNCSLGQLSSNSSILRP